MKPTFEVGRGLYVMSALLIGITGFLILLKSPVFFQVAAFQSDEPVVHQQQVAKDAPVTTLLLVDMEAKQEPSIPVIEERLSQMKIGYKTIDYREWKDEGSYQTLILASEDWKGLNREQLLTFIERGGNLLIALRPSPETTFQSLYQQLGVIEYGGFVITEAIQIKSPFFTLNEDLELVGEEFEQSMVAVRLHDQAVVKASSGDGNPFLWTFSLGEGTVYFFNGTFNDGPVYSPFLTWMLSQTVAPIYPVIYAGATLLEGFPFPTQTNRTLHGKSEKNYYRQDWWLQMQSLEAKFNLNFTAATAFPNQLNEDTLYNDELSLYAREIVLLGGEIAVKELRDLESEQKRIQQVVGDYKLETFLSKEEQVSGPVGSLFFQQGSLPVKPSDEERWQIIRHAIDYGFQEVTFSPYRVQGNEEDEEMWEAWEEYLEFSEDIYRPPYYPIRFVNYLARQWKDNEVVVTRQENQLTVEMSHFSEETFFHFYSEEPLGQTVNCEVTKLAENFYLVQALDSKFSIETE